MIDVSEFQNAVTWRSVPAGTRTLVRMTYGATGVDARGAQNLAAARASGLPVGGYHFLENGDGAGEVAHFLAHFTPRPGALRGMIDVERSPYSDPTKARVVAAIAEYLRRTGHHPIVYGTHDVLAALELPVEYAASCPLMLAGYGPDNGQQHPPGPAPAPWTAIAVHQYTSKGSCSGVAGDVDLSHVYDGRAIIVPRPRPLLDEWRIAYVDGHGRHVAALSRLPSVWLHLHPRAKYRGAVTITPHRR
jgi:lysozyme